jgi:hypothetical protein
MSVIPVEDRKFATAWQGVSEGSIAEHGGAIDDVKTYDRVVDTVFDQPVQTKYGQKGGAQTYYGV